MEAGGRGLPTLPTRQSCPRPGLVLRGSDRPYLKFGPLHTRRVALDQALALSLCLNGVKLCVMIQQLFVQHECPVTVSCLYQYCCSRSRNLFPQPHPERPKE